MTSAREQEARVRRLLQVTLRLKGVSNREIERRLGFSNHSGYLSRIFAGTRQLKMSQVLEILEAAGIPPGNFFRGIFPDHDGAGPARELEDLLAVRSRCEAEDIGTARHRGGS